MSEGGTVEAEEEGVGGQGVALTGDQPEVWRQAGQDREQAGEVFQFRHD